MTDEKERLALSKEHLKHDADSIKLPVCVLDRHWVTITDRDVVKNVHIYSGGGRSFNRQYVPFSVPAVII